MSDQFAESSTEIPDIVSFVLNAKKQMERLSAPYRTRSYQNLIDTMEQYLEKTCQHIPIIDYVDTHCEASHRIVYCKICYCTIHE